MIDFQLTNLVIKLLHNIAYLIDSLKVYHNHSLDKPLLDFVNLSESQLPVAIYCLKCDEMQM